MTMETQTPAAFTSNVIATELKRVTDRIVAMIGELSQ
jgi:hypothetical protein